MENKKNQKNISGKRQEALRFRGKYIAAAFISCLGYFLLRALFGRDVIEGANIIMLHTDYLAVFAAQLLAVTFLSLLPLKHSGHNNFRFALLMPPAVFSAFGMMRITSLTDTTSETANYFPSAGFLIFLAAVILMCVLRFPPIGAVGMLGGAMYSPFFACAFSPFIALAGFFIKVKGREKIYTAANILNVFICAGTVVYSFFNLKGSYIPPLFNKRYLTLIPFIAALAVFIYFVAKKNGLGKLGYPLSLLSLMLLPPVVLHIFTGCFSIPEMSTASAVAASTAVIFAVSAGAGNSAFDFYLKKLEEHPAVYILILSCILRVTAFIFVTLGLIRKYLP